MFRAFNLSSKYGRSKAEKILLTYQTFAISVKVPTPYTTQPPCHNCVAILGDLEHGLYWVQSGVLPKKFGHKLFLSLSAQLDNV